MFFLNPNSSSLSSHFIPFSLLPLSLSSSEILTFSFLLLQVIPFLSSTHLKHQLTNGKLTRKCHWRELNLGREFSPHRSSRQSFTQSEARHRLDCHCSSVCNQKKFGKWSLSSHSFTWRRKGVYRMILSFSFASLAKQMNACGREMLHCINLKRLTCRSSTLILQVILMTSFEMKWAEYTRMCRACVCVCDRRDFINLQSDKQRETSTLSSFCRWKV